MLSNIEEIISEAKQGRVFILVDDENRENEGDLVIPAEKASAEVINFMAKHGRGLICLALDKNRVQQLELPLMAQHNRSRHQTAFTVSIEAKEGISTGISASDRAKTIAVAIDKNKSKNDIVSPGHIFPLVAKDGGVLTRAGHTEAAVDIAKLAGLNPSGVICEIMNEDGTMARLPDLIEFSKLHNIKISTIADLIEYRRKNEKLVEKVSENIIEIDGLCSFKAIIYKSLTDNFEHLALVKGNINKADDVLVRMHKLNFFSDIILAGGSKKKNMLRKSLELITENGCGVAVILVKNSKNFISENFETLNPAYNQNTKVSDNIIRDYGTGAQILNDLGVKNMTLITNNEKNIIALDGYGIKINGFKSPLQAS